MNKPKKLGTKKPRKRGRPVTYVIPPPIPDTPENIALACMQGPPKKEWDFLKPGSGAKAEKRRKSEEENSGKNG